MLTLQEAHWLMKLKDYNYLLYPDESRLKMACNACRSNDDSQGGLKLLKN